MGATAVTVAVIAGAALGGANAYMQGKSERDQLKQQYKIDSYNAQMDKMENEVELARQDKLLQKNLAETMAMQNNLFGEIGLDPTAGDAWNLLEGTNLEGQAETRSIRAQEELVQNKYITTEAIRRKNFNRNMRNNSISTTLNTIAGTIQGGMSFGSSAAQIQGNSGGNVQTRNVTNTAGSGGNVRFTNASYRG